VGDELAKLAVEFAKMPVQDLRSIEEILGYDEHGLPS